MFFKLHPLGILSFSDVNILPNKIDQFLKAQKNFNPFQSTSSLFVSF